MTPATRAPHPALVASCEDTTVTLEAAARRVRVTPRYLREMLKKGGMPYVLAVRTAPVIGLSEDALLRGGIRLPRQTTKGGVAKVAQGSRAGTARP